jgi:hypothetical protein
LHFDANNMKNRKNLIAAVCGLGGALSICGFAARAPGHTLAVVLTPGSGSAFNPYAACDSSGGIIAPLGARAGGFTSNLTVLCVVDDFSGSTQHKACDGATIVGVALGAFDAGGIYQKVYCSASGAWGTDVQCSKTISYATVSPPNIPVCHNRQFTATGWGGDP